MNTTIVISITNGLDTIAEAVTLSPQETGAPSPVDPVERELLRLVDRVRERLNDHRQDDADTPASDPDQAT